MDKKNNSKLVKECLALAEYKAPDAQLRLFSNSPQNTIVYFKHKKTPRVT